MTKTYRAVLKINDVTEGEKELSVGAGKSLDVSFPVSKSAEGTYAVTLGDISGKFVVKSSQQASGFQSDWITWGGLAAGVLLIIVLAVILVRRRSY